MRWSVFIDAQSLALAWDAVRLGGWMSGAVLSARFSGLAPKWRPWADTLSLLAGPLGWFAHLLPRAWAWVVAARSREPDPAGYEQTANDILAAALVAGAGDIHLEAQEKGYVVRFRQFGLMQEHLRCGRRAGEMLVSVYKVFADLNTA